MDYDNSDLYRGLAALHWSTIDGPGRDLDFYKGIIEQSGSPALDVGCGAGRLLRAFLRVGLDVEGLDVSGDMLDVCREKATKESLDPVLYEQPMQCLELPRRYRTIVVPCGSFGCVREREAALETLRRFQRHLKPGGTLVFTLSPPDYDYSGTEHRQRFPRMWTFHTEKMLPDGRRLRVYRRLAALDPVEQVWSEDRRYELYEGQGLQREEIRSGHGRWYYRNELLWMLRLAGFRRVRVTGDYTYEPFAPEHAQAMTFVARK